MFRRFFGFKAVDMLPLDRLHTTPPTENGISPKERTIRVYPDFNPANKVR